MNHVQLVLGVITGACIGLFLTASDAGTSGTALSGTSVPLSTDELGAPVVALLGLAAMQSCDGTA